MDNSIMKTTSAKTNNFQSDSGDSSTSTSLDENLWGTLQHHIGLAENVYSKLPFEEFFHLRTVCKDWYVIACKRLGLKEPIHKPFFNLFTKGVCGRLDGILFYNALSRSWDWRPDWSHNRYTHFVASEGVVFSAAKSSATYAGAFYSQSRLYQHVFLPATGSNTSRKMILGMIVSVEQDPFGSISPFSVVCGSPDFDTQVYESGVWQTKPRRVPMPESGVWQTKPCRVPKPDSGGPLQATTGCADCNGRVYITTEHSREIFVYDFEKARWSSLLSPRDWVSSHPWHYCLDTLGAWNDRVFDVTCNFKSGRRKKRWSLEVWELVDETLHKWKVYNCMPKALCSWLRSRRCFEHSLNIRSRDFIMQASFCGDFLLVYSWDFRNGTAGRFCLFNMATKNWEKLNIAAGTVAVTVDYPSDDSLDLYANAFDSSLGEFTMEDDDDDMDSDSGWDIFLL